jgi:hypothetical protein
VGVFAACISPTSRRSTGVDEGGEGGRQAAGRRRTRTRPRTRVCTRAFSLRPFR